MLIWGLAWYSKRLLKNDIGFMHIKWNVYECN